MTIKKILSDTFPIAASADGFSASLLAHALASTSCGITVADARQPHMPLIYCNPAFTRVTGYAPDEVLGYNCRFLQGSDTNPATVAAIRTAIKEGRHLKVVLRNYRKDKTPFWNELILSPVYSEQGELTYFIGVQNDVTSQKRAEDALQDLNRELDERVYRRTQELMEALQAAAESREQALLLVGLTLEYRDYETKGHTERVTHAAGRLGQALGLDKQLLNDLRWGSYLHDTGKIAVPDHVLLKPGKLTSDEFRPYEAPRPHRGGDA
jgi:PAS domain S-box-containing protein